MGDFLLVYVIYLALAVVPLLREPEVAAAFRVQRSLGTSGDPARGPPDPLMGDGRPR